MVSGQDHSDAQTVPMALDKRLQEFARFEINWDGYGAPQIAEGAISRARSILSEAHTSLPKPFVSPTRHGGVGMEWKLEVGSELLLEVSRYGGLSYLLVVPQLDGEEEEIEGVVGSFRDLQSNHGPLATMKTRTGFP